MPASSPPWTARLGQGLLIATTWLLLAGLAAWTAAQLHATLMYAGLKAVENPALRPAGWTPNTLFGLSRFLTLCLGAAWLMAVAFIAPLLSDAQRRGRYRRTTATLFLSLAAVFALTYLLLLLLAA